MGLSITQVQQSVLPAGAATETTMGTRLADSTFTARIPTLGQKTMAGSLAVVLASDQSTLPVSISGTVPISASALPLPTGASTETTLAAVSGKLPATLGQKVMASSLAVTLASDQSAIPVSGTITANIGTSGSLALDATLTGGSAKAISRGGAKGTTTAADVTSTASGANHQPLDVALYDASGNQLGLSGSPIRTDPTGTTVQPISASALPLPSGASTETTLAAMSGKLPASLGQKVMASSLAVTLASDQSTLPVSIAGTVAVSASALPLPTGAATSANQTTLGAQTTKINDGTNTAAIKAASTAAAAADPALVASLSPNSPISGKATVFPPVLTAGTINPISMDTGGNARVANIGIADFGNILGTPWALPFEVSEDFRARSEIDNLIDHESMNQSAQNTAKHRVDNATMAFTFSGGFNTNTGSITTINTGVAFSTYQYFPLLGGHVTRAYLKGKFSGTMNVTNTTIDFGFFTKPTTAPYAPTDGAFFRTDSTGVYGCVSYNGTLVTTSPFKTVFGGGNWVPTIGTEYDMIVDTWPMVTVFWVDLKDGNGYQMMGRINDSASQPSNALQGSLPLSVRHAIGGTAASASQGFTLIEYSVFVNGAPNGRHWSEAATAMGLSGAQGISGQTMGSSSNYTNNLAVGSGAALTNTTALVTTLGGQAAVQPTLAVGTDGIIFGFQNPAPTANLTGHTLIIDSVKISAVVTAAFTGGPVIYAYSLAWGHTAVSLATAESQNTKAPRRKPLGTNVFPVTSPVGQVPTGSAGDQVLLSDVALNPGEFVAICAKNIGTVTTAGVICFEVLVTSHYI